MGNVTTIDGSDYLVDFITEKEAFQHSHYYEVRALDVETGEWHPTYCMFHSPLGKQEWGEIID